MANTASQRQASIDARIKARYAAAEAAAKAEAAGDPSFQDVFTKYQTYMTYLQNLPDDERQAILGDLTEEANALVDKPFDAETERLKKDLDLRVRTANQQYGALDENTQQQLSQAIAKADRDTVDALTENFESVVSQGLMNGGILTQLADKVLQNKENYVKDLRATADLDTSTRAAQKSLAMEGITNYGEEQTSDISDRRRISRSVQESELYDEQATLKFIGEQGLASQLLPKDLATQLERLNSSSVPPPAPTTSRLPDTYNPPKTPATPQSVKQPLEDVASPDKKTLISLTQRRILAGPRPSIRGTRAAASSQY